MLFYPIRVWRAGLALLLFVGLTAAAQPHHSPAEPVPVPDRPATHGMLVFGSAQVFASHLPMFHPPHDYQVLLELSLPDSARAVYAASRTAFPAEAVYTLEPERLVLPDLLARPRPFWAVLYRGHFERGGKAITRRVRVEIKQVLYARRLTPPPTHPEAGTAFVLGNAQEQFLVHRIGGQPDFDQVLPIVLTDVPTRQLLARHVMLPWRSAAPAQNSKAPRCSQPVPPRSSLTGELEVAPGHWQPAALRTGPTLYLEIDDLR